MRRTSLIIALALAACSAPQAKTDNAPTADNAKGDGMMAHVQATAENDTFMYREQIAPAVRAVVASGLLIGPNRAKVSELNRSALLHLDAATKAKNANDEAKWAMEHQAFYGDCRTIVAILTDVTSKKVS